MPVRPVSAGSSPRGRGKRRGRACKRTEQGLIPARAGKTERGDRIAAPRQAHPRAGGENEAGDEKGATFEGSSPRGRGKLGRDGLEEATGRLIPARAGKTSASRRCASPRRAHPRAGGENGRHSMPTVRMLGSSPRGRGKLGVCAIGACVYGLIPARAGKTALGCAAVSDCGAHPRAGGENVNVFCMSCMYVGSSPRGRGKLRLPRLCLVWGRLIPARAGKTPRPAEMAPVSTGSSPRGRGKRVGG